MICFIIVDVGRNESKWWILTVMISSHPSSTVLCRHLAIMKDYETKLHPRESLVKLNTLNYDSTYSPIRRRCTTPERAS